MTKSIATHPNQAFTTTWRPLTETEFKTYSEDIYYWEIGDNLEGDQSRDEYLKAEYQRYSANWHKETFVSMLEIRHDDTVFQSIVVDDELACGYFDDKGEFQLI
jgi:hypothetical protein